MVTAEFVQFVPSWLFCRLQDPERNKRSSRQLAKGNRHATHFAPVRQRAVHCDSHNILFKKYSNNMRLFQNI